MSNTELWEQGGKNKLCIMIYEKSDKGNGITDVTYNSNKFVFSGNSIKGHISTPEEDVVYRGNIHIENDDWETAYINLINYNSNGNPPIRIKVKDMKILSDDLIEIENKSIRLSSIPLGTCVQIVEFTDIFSEFDTNSIETEKVINTNPFVISFPEDSYGKEYVIWVGNMCKKACV